jgi:hypothetical protein
MQRARSGDGSVFLDTTKLPSWLPWSFHLQQPRSPRGAEQGLREWR